MPELPDDMAVVIEVDTDYDPATSVDWPADETAAYVERFRRGELTAYGVMLVKGVARDVIGSLWGCDVETSNADNVYYTLASIPDDYLREVAVELLAEVTHG